MAIPTRGVSAPANAAREYHGFDRETLIQAFRIMQMARRIDDREVILKRQNRIWFQISGAGHECIQTAAGLLLRPGEDWFFTYYRDRALALALGVSPEQMLLASMGAAGDTSSGGRQMPSHWSDPALHIFTGSSPTGTQFVQAMGAADARRLVNPGSQDLTLCCSGEGATSEGEFWESLNAACLGRLPLLYLVEDNGWAISVPVEQQTAGGSISRLVSGFPNLLAVECDGRDFMDSVGALRQAIDWVRLGSGPALVHAHVIRPYSHSLSDDERLYKTAAERAAEAATDPIVTYPRWLISEGLLDEQTYKRMCLDVDAEIQEIAARVLHAAPPERTSALEFLYSPDVDPCSVRFESEPDFHGEPRTMVDSINRTLNEEMARNERIVVFGEDVADCSRVENLKEVKGKGGVFMRGALFQHADRRGKHHRARHRHGGARPDARPGDSVLRLHLAGDDADSRGAGHHPLALGQRLESADGDPRADRRLSDRRIDLPQPMRGSRVHPPSGAAGRVSVQRAGCLRAAAHGAARGRPGAVPGTQAAVPRAVQPFAAPGSELHHSPGSRAHRQTRAQPGDRHLRRNGAEVVASGHADRESPARNLDRGARPAQSRAIRLGVHSGFGEEDLARADRARRHAELRLRRRDRRAHRR
jgi:TPP-dependent pyruvate/acetoin dehydrogenase alpha subunit